MTKARRSLVSLSDTPYYHCISRCVRRAFLCGEDEYTSRSYSHRRDWVVERLEVLSGVFAVEVCAYAIMSNHYHLVVRIDRERAVDWSVAECIERWCALFKGPEVVQRYCAGEVLEERERTQVSEMAEQWRERLYDISWYMKCLNEHIARRANAEDGCTGHFWEGRFKCQALLDEAAVVTAMAYVDLNPIRAGMAEDIAGSDKTSVQQRLRETVVPGVTKADIPLLPFLGVETRTSGNGLPFNLQDYLDLADWTGRCVRDDKRGAIRGDAPKLLLSLGIAEHQWLPIVVEMQARFELVMGSPERLQRFAALRGGKFYRGIGHARCLYARLPAA